MTDDSNNEEPKGKNWTMFKEIVGTFFGVAPYVLAVVVWGATVNERLRVTEIRLDHAESATTKADQTIREARIELFSRLDQLTGKIELLQQDVARIATVPRASK